MIRAVVGGASLTRWCCQSSFRRVVACQPSLQYFARIGRIGSPRLLSNSWNSLRQNGTWRDIVRKQSTGSADAGSNEVPKKLSLFAKFKQMYKDYWYVMLPVHMVTSVGWFGAFYQVSKSGVDVGIYLRKVGIGESVIKQITESGLGHFAVAGALYKIATPLRYAVTLGGTTCSINVLRNMGYIKPAKELMAKGRDKIQSIKDKQLPKK